MPLTGPHLFQTATAAGAQLLTTFGAGALIFVYRREIQDALDGCNRRGPRPPTGLLPSRDFLPLRKGRFRFRKPDDYATRAKL